MLRYVEGIGDWVRFPETVHEAFAHLPEAIGSIPLTSRVISLLREQRRPWPQDLERGESRKMSQMCQVCRSNIAARYPIFTRPAQRPGSWSIVHPVCLIIASCLRRIREKKACLTDSRSNLRDVARRWVNTGNATLLCQSILLPLLRMNVVSDPVVRTVAPQLLCRRCAEVHRIVG
jgi:hypothetical protein